MTRWEYLTVTQTRTTDINALGEDGWELVSAVRPDRSAYTVLYFKRRKEATP